MAWYVVISIICLSVCLSAVTWHFLRLLQLGKPLDHASPAGSVKKGVIYSFTGAMSPAKKESAYLHLPTYAAGLVFHLGTFFAILIFLLALVGIRPAGILAYGMSVPLFVSFACGAGILLKRMHKRSMRELSNPDDYISNILVTLFQLFSAVAFLLPAWEPAWYVSASLVCLWLPLGKLKHSIYFFAARYHLGFFFGRRGVWPPSDREMQ